MIIIIVVKVEVGIPCKHISLKEQDSVCVFVLKVHAALLSFNTINSSVWTAHKASLLFVFIGSSFIMFREGLGSERALFADVLPQSN